MERKVLIIGSQEDAAVVEQELSGSFKTVICKDEKGVLDSLEKERPFTLVVFGCRAAREIRNQLPKGFNCHIVTIVKDSSSCAGILEESPDDELVPKELIPLSLLSIVRSQAAGMV